MFLRVRGRRAYLVHNVRDGRSRVRQRCLFRTDLQDGLAGWLSEQGWAAIRQRLQERCPEIRVDWDRLRRQLLEALPLAESSPGAGRRRRRTHYDESEPEAQSYLQEIERQGELLRQGECWGELCLLLSRRNRRCFSSEGPAELALALQRAGRWQEAVQQWQLLPRCQARRHFNAGLACWRAGQLEDATENMLQGLMRDRRVGDALRIRQLNWDYWKCYGDLWCRRSQNFLLSVMADRAVLHRLRCREPGRLIPRSWQRMGWWRHLMSRVRERVAAAGDRELRYTPRWFLVDSQGPARCG